jgi:DNA-binding NarL/FixJ family response regulator
MPHLANKIRSRAVGARPAGKGKIRVASGLDQVHYPLLSRARHRPPMGSLRVVLVEDHTLMRAGIRALLQALPDVEVVGEADNGPDAVSLVASTRPDLILLDITIPEMNGLEVAERVAKEYAPTRTIILSMHTDAVYVRKALQAGASGYIVKDAGVQELEAAIRAVMRG